MHLTDLDHAKPTVHFFCEAICVKAFLFHNLNTMIS